MTKQIRMTALALLGAIGLTFAAPTAAHASKKGKRNTAIALGAVAAYGLIKKKPLIAGLAGAGAVYSWLQSNKDGDRDRDRDRRRNRNRRAYRNGGYYNGYQPVYQQAPVYQRPYYAGNGYNGYNGYRGRSRYSGNRGYNSYDAGRHSGGRGHAYGRQRRCD
jgi:hypothetical protein